MPDLRFPQVNNVFISGRLCRDPELKHTKNGKASVKTSMAVDNGFGDNKQTMFVSLQLWGDYAEKMHPHLRKGSPLLVAGRLDVYEYETSEGETRKDVAVVAYRVDVLAWPADKDSAEKSPQRATWDADAPEDDIPF